MALLASDLFLRLTVVRQAQTVVTLGAKSSIGMGWVMWQEQGHKKWGFQEGAIFLAVREEAGHWQV